VNDKSSNKCFLYPGAESGRYAAFVLLSLCGWERTGLSWSAWASAAERGNGSDLPARLFVSAAETPHRRSSDEPLSGLPKIALVKKLREVNGPPVRTLQNDELLGLMAPTIRADYELCETYKYHPEYRPECPMAIHGGLEDHGVESER
jgi:surfactin synthase thioesterase subunit